MSYKPVPIEPCQPIAEKRGWGTELFIAWSPHYLGKILTYHAGHKGGLQYHVEKDETFHLLSGRAYVSYDAGDGLVRKVMLPGESYRVPPFAVHQFEAIEECVVFEVSTPHYHDRVRMEGHYFRTQPEGLPTTR